MYGLVHAHAHTCSCICQYMHLNETRCSSVFARSHKPKLDNVEDMSMDVNIGDVITHGQICTCTCTCVGYILFAPPFDVCCSWDEMSCESQHFVLRGSKDRDICSSFSTCKTLRWRRKDTVWMGPTSTVSMSILKMGWFCLPAQGQGERDVCPLQWDSFPSYILHDINKLVSLSWLMIFHTI